MSLARKFNLKPGMKVRLVGRPAGVDLDDVDATSGGGDGVLLFVESIADLEAGGAPAIEAAKQDRISWVAYPKAGQRGTDLNRDILWQAMAEKGVRGVRQVAIDDVWSALRFRPQ